MMATYVGRIASRSTIPKKLSAYFRFFLTTASRTKYSTVKISVKTHSRNRNCTPYSDLSEPTLSSITTPTLTPIKTSRVISNICPAFVSDKKMIRHTRSRSGDVTAMVSSGGVSRSVILLKLHYTSASERVESGVSRFVSPARLTPRSPGEPDFPCDIRSLCR